MGTFPSILKHNRLCDSFLFAFSHLFLFSFSLHSFLVQITTMSFESKAKIGSQNIKFWKLFFYLFVCSSSFASHRHARQFQWSIGVTCAGHSKSNANGVNFHSFLFLSLSRYLVLSSVFVCSDFLVNVSSSIFNSFRTLDQNVSKSFVFFFRDRKMFPRFMCYSFIFIVVSITWLTEFLAPSQISNDYAQVLCVCMIYLCSHSTRTVIIIFCSQCDVSKIFR